MKMTTDSVLLGAWASVMGCRLILDIGTGTGIIALMMAQRNEEVRIDAVEIDNEAAHLAVTNFSNSRFSERLNGYHASIQDYSDTLETTYDLIVSNPPYFNNSLTADDINKTWARHTVLLSHEDLIQSVEKMISPNGLFEVILPFHEGKEFIDKALKTERFYLAKLTKVYSSLGKSIERLLISLSRKPKTNPLVNKLVIRNSVKDKDYTEEFIGLTKEFYLFM